MDKLHILLAAETGFHIRSFPVTNSLLVSLTVSIFLIIFAAIFSKTFKKIPQKTQNVIEIIVETFSDLAESIGGPKTRDFLPLVISIFLYVLLCNWIGLLPGFGSIGIKEIKDGHEVLVPLFRGASADLNTTLALALVSFFAIQFFGFSHHKLGYLKRFINFSSPVAFFTGILEIISEFAKIISFSFRLFGNVFAGEVLLAVVISLVPVVVPLPFFGLEIFVGFIQALVFAMLTLVFINIAVSHGEEVEPDRGH